ncbi:MAG: M20/M25/M40 family metallo-hydrolase [Chloroflexota bacterium]
MTNHPPLQNIHDLEKMLTERLPAYLEMLRQMVEINSFTANAEGVNRVGRLTADFFAPLGFEADFVPSERKDFGNHLFLQRSANQLSSPTIAMISHLDTVFSPQEEQANDFVWRPSGHRVYGPGCVDIKGGTVMIFMVLEALKTYFPEVYHHTHWLICLNASEEVLSQDFSQQCLERLPETTCGCLVFEAGNIQDNKFKLVVARKGRAYFRVEVEGKSAHAGNNHDAGANAIVQMAHTIQQIASFTDYSRQITFNVGRVGGGTVVNRVPHYAEAEVEMRCFSPQVFTEGVNRMLALDGSSQVSSTDGFPCTVSVQILERTMPWPINERTHQLFQVWEQAAQQLGMEVEMEKRGGLSDGNYLWDRFPTLDGLGPAGNNAHCSESDPANGKDQEYVSVSSFVPKALLNVTALLKLLGDG